MIRKVIAIVWKDVLIELRTKEMLSSMLVFVLLVIFIFNFAFGPGMEGKKGVAPGILWVAFIFAGVLGLNRAFASEKDEGCLQGLMLCPVDRSTIYVGKVVGNVIFTSVVEAIALGVFSILFNVSILGLLPGLALVIFLSTIGFASVGTLFSAMSVNTKAREVMLPILLFPIIVPVVISAVKSTGLILSGGSLNSIIPWLKLLIAFDIIFTAISFLTFEYVIEE